MQTQTPYPAAIGRNIANEMAEHARERGEGLTFKDYKRLGFTDAQIIRYSDEAAAIYARRAMRRVA
ncbi:hypothetical protein SAMN05216228_100239 [Rhizobium tibeticum]|uniref:Uncharacterized protein n=1 Tax=Rhizobium tibeticum TaxID=501024 RepID=A0A1H8DGX8_9HYPH|nr:hypothetical protein [Rhizobium tibeticum]SEH51627.1 hypothetical protein RTCCBAU85039_0860 [Rhizobium tibeticum]SEN06054.1 hypothetical protein SAMN05216228_100239 [Rhizobium tibeticum]